MLILDLVIIFEILVLSSWYDTLSLDAMVSIYSMAIVISSVYTDCYDRFYPQIHLANCIYVQKH